MGHWFCKLKIYLELPISLLQRTLEYSGQRWVILLHPALEWKHNSATTDIFSLFESNRKAWDIFNTSRNNTALTRECTSLKWSKYVKVKIRSLPTSTKFRKKFWIFFRWKSLKNSLNFTGKEVERTYIKVNPPYLLSSESKSDNSHTTMPFLVCFKPKCI